MTIYVLTIEHRHGTNISVHQTRAGAEASLDEYVREYWHELSRERPPEMPKAAEERIEIYFEDHPQNETFDIVECEVQA